MGTNNFFPGISFKTAGLDKNYFSKISVSTTTYGGDSVSGSQPSGIITFPTTGIQLINLGTGVVEVSFNGQTTHCELASGTTSANLMFNHRQVSLFWLRVQAGSSGPIIVTVSGW